MHHAYKGQRRDRFPTPNPQPPELSFFKADFGMKLKISYCFQTDKSSPLPDQKSNRIKSNLSPPKILQKHQAYSLDRSTQTFLTRFPLVHGAFSSPSLSFSISQILISFPHLPHILAVLRYYAAYHHQQQQYQFINRRVSFRSDQSGNSNDIPLHLQWINMLMA